MATKKITELTAANNLSSNSLLVAVIDPGGTASTKKITVANFFSNVATSASFNSTVSVAGNTSANVVTATSVTTTSVTSTNLTVNTGVFTNNLIIPYIPTPANSSSLTISNNAIFHDGNYLYVATSNNVTKRVALTTF